MNDSYNVEIEILTPVHIGDGNTISGIDYFCYKEQLKPPYKQTDDGKDIKHQSYLYKYKINDFKSILDEKDKKELETLFLSGNDTFEIRNFIYVKIELEKNKYKQKFLLITREKIEIKNSFYNNWKDKIIGKPKQSYGKTQEKRKAEFTNQLSQLEIKSFTKSLGRYYIPGSSLKGAIRTVLLKKYSNNIAIENDPFKKLIVRDSSFINSGIEIGKLARQSNTGEGQYSEFLKIGLKTEIEIIFKDFLDEKELEKLNISKDIIIKKSNDFTDNKIKKYICELEEFKSHKDINKKNARGELDSGSNQKQLKIDSTIDSFNKILFELNNLHENECILNIGFGGGYWFKSFEGDENHPNKHGIKNLKDDSISIPRTSNNIDLENLGFIKLTFKD